MSCNLINIQAPPCKITATTKNWKQLIINARAIVPSTMPDIQSISSINSILKINSTNFIQTPDSINISNMEGTYLTGLKMIVNGQINQTITYEGIGGCKLYSFNYISPFTSFIVLDPDYDISQNVCLQSCVENLLVSQINCRQVASNIAVLLALN